MIGREFFERTPLECAEELIGATLSWGLCAGVIVETEAYDAEGDAACHTFFRPTARAFVRDRAAGTAYVYINYGIHWLLNVLVKGEREGFVLIRAVEPTVGFDLMMERRRMQQLVKLCAGPGRLTQAFGIGRDDHGRDLCGGEVGFVARRERPVVVADGRIGISQAAELPWRFTLGGSRFVSRRVRR